MNFFNSFNSISNSNKSVMKLSQHWNYLRRILLACSWLPKIDLFISLPGLVSFIQIQLADWRHSIFNFIWWIQPRQWMNFNLVFIVGPFKFITDIKWICWMPGIKLNLIDFFNELNVFNSINQSLNETNSGNSSSKSGRNQLNVIEPNNAALSLISIWFNSWMKANKPRNWLDWIN